MCVFIKDSQNVWHKYLGTGFLYDAIDFFFQANVPVPYKSCAYSSLLEWCLI